MYVSCFTIKFGINGASCLLIVASGPVATTKHLHRNQSKTNENEMIHSFDVQLCQENDDGQAGSRLWGNSLFRLFAILK